MIHTIISLNDVFFNCSSCEIVTKKVDGGYAEYIKHDGQLQFRRLISTDPAMYLRSQYQNYQQ